MEKKKVSEIAVGGNELLASPSDRNVATSSKV